MALSFWEAESFQSWDYIVVGGGIVGLSTAISLKEKKPFSSVLVLERGLLPTGASTKNAGFACFGSLTELIGDIELMGEERCLNLIKRRWYGLQKLRQRTGDLTIDYQQKGGYELITAKEEHSLSQIDRVNKLLARFFGIRVFQDDKTLVAKFGFEAGQVRTVVANPLEGQLHSGKMMRELQKIATSKGISILTGCEVNQHMESGDEVKVSVRSLGGEEIEFKCGKLAFCTNAFAKNYFADLDIKPGRGIVMVTGELPRLPFEGAFHMDEGFYYFRNVGKRILLGGGRHLDMATETTTEFGNNENILKELKRLLAEVLVPGSDLKTDYLWSGIMAFGETKEPIMKKISDRVAVGVRLGGMGVAVGSLLGDELADLLTGEQK